MLAFLNKLAVRVSVCLALVVLGVIFALCFRLPAQRALQTGDNAYTVGPITSRTAFVQQLNVAGPGRISSVEVLLATWGKRANTTHDEIRIFDGDGRQVQAKKLPPGTVADDAYVRVDLPDPIEFDGPDRFFVSLSSSDGSAAHSITAWVTSATVAGRLYSLPSADLGHGSLVKKIDHARPLRGAICVRVLGQGPRRLLDEQTLRVGGLLVFLALAACAWWVLSFAHLPDPSSAVRPAPPDLKNRRLHLLVLIVFAGTVASLMFHYVAGRVLHWDHVRASFLLGLGGPLADLGNTFADLTGPLESARASISDSVVWLPPTPFFHVLYLALVPLGRAGALLLQYGVFLAGMALVVWRTYVDALTSRVERVTYLLILLALSYPVLFVLERGNIEMLLFIVMAGFLYLYYVKGSVWCVGLLAIAISMKMFPAVFLVLLLADRRYKWALYTVLCTACVTFGSLVLLALLLGRGYVDLIHTSVNALSEINRVYVGGFSGLSYGHSLWGLLVFLAARMPRSSAWLVGIDQNTFVARAAFPYTIVVLVAFAALAVFVIRAVELPWQRVALLTVAALALPTVSGDYRLLYAYLPLAMLLNAPVRTRVDMTCVALLGCLLVPTDYVYGVVLRIPGWTADHTSVSVVVYPLVMIALVAVIVWDVLAESRPPGSDAVRLRSTWLRLYACVLGVPLIWLSKPLAHAVGMRLHGWPSLNPHFLGGFVLSAPQKPAELIQYAFAAAALVAYFLAVFRQIEATDRTRRQLLIDWAGERLRLPLVVCGAVAVSVLLSIFARGRLSLPGLVVECCLWLAVAVLPFIPASRRTSGGPVTDAHAECDLEHATPQAEQIAPATDTEVTM